MIDWNKVNKADRETISKIVDRAVKLYPSIDKLSVNMDLSAAHIATPLRLKELLEADNGNFGHDVFGISKYINRNNGKMHDCFVPRFAEREAIKAAEAE